MKVKTCPECGSAVSQCPECGWPAPMGTVARCRHCPLTPMDCAGCCLTVRSDLAGVLKAADDST